MTGTITKAFLSPQRKHLLELLQGLNFGCVEALRVRNGEPVFDPSPRIVREVKFGSENGPHPKINAENFALKSQVRELFEQMEELRNGTILCLEVKHGLPFKMTILEDVA